MFINRTLKVLAGTLGLALASSDASAQKVFASHDEWLTLNGYFNANEQQLVNNALSWFGAGNGSSVLLYSPNSYLTNAGFQNHLTGLGMSVTVDAAPASFAGYNVIFASGNLLQDNAGLVSYVQGGGNVFYIGGTGIGGPAVEAGYSNPFLNAFGLSFASVYNGISNPNVVTSLFAGQAPFGAALFTGVNSIFADNGNSISAIAPVSGWTTQVFNERGGQGVFGAAAMDVNVVPEPSTVLLMVGGLLAVVPFARRRKTR